jgi:O-antigen/teichoic acid export membrane protein
MPDDDPRSRQGSGALQILIATAIGGGSGYILTIFAGASLGAVRYGVYAVFWSALYLVVSAISGIQPEVSRATRPVEHNSDGRPLVRNFAIVTAACIGLATLLSSPLWIGTVFHTTGFGLVVPLAVGLASYAIVAALSGVLFGLQVWRAIAALIAIDGVLRLVITGSLLLVTHDLNILAWGLVAPFFIAPIAVWFVVRKRVVGHFTVDVTGYRQLIWNVARTVVGAAAIGTLISGFPLLLGATSSTDPRSQVAALIFAINLTRAPIVIVVLSLQSFLVVFFRSRREHYWRYLGAILGAIAVVTALVTIVVAWLGPWVLETFFGHGYVLGSVVLGALVGSAGAVAFLCATGPAVLALGRHALYTTGWVVAALVTLGILLLPLPVTERTILALWIGPLSGLLVHVAVLVRKPRPALCRPE